MTDTIRVAVVHGGADARLDGVADYVGHLVDALPAVGVEAVPVVFRSLLDTRRRVRRLAPDLVHVQFAPSAYGFSRAPGRLPLVLGRTPPLVTTVHEYGGRDRGTGRLLLASASVAVTNEAHGALVRAGTAVPVRMIPLAPNVSCRGAARPRRAGPVLAFFGFVHPVKGVRYLIEAVATLAARYPELRLVVVGGFTSRALPQAEAARFRDELVAVARHCGVADRVEFTGYLPPDEVSARLAGADVGVLPFTEGVTTKSGALLTLFAHRLPTVATLPDQPDPALRDVCVVRARRDAGALATAIDTVLSDRELRDRLATGAARFAAERDWSRVAREHRRWYEDVLGRHG